MIKCGVVGGRRKRSGWGPVCEVRGKVRGGNDERGALGVQRNLPAAEGGLEWRAGVIPCEVGMMR